MDRVSKVLEELGEAVDVRSIISKQRVPVVDDRKFVEYLSRLVARFSHHYSLCTARLDYVTKAVLLLSYRRPPKVAFVQIDVEDGSGGARVRVPNGSYTIRLDKMWRVLGPSVKFRREKLDKVVVGDYVPVSGEYLVSNYKVEGATPKYVVRGTRRWLLYPCINPVPFNVVALLLS